MITLVSWPAVLKGGGEKSLRLSEREEIIGELLSSSDLIVMCLHVAMEVPRLRETEITYLAPVWFLPTVDSLVFGEG